MRDVEAATINGSIDGLLAAVLRGEKPPWPFTSGGEEREVVRRAIVHNVHVLAADATRRSPSNWPEGVRARLWELATSEAVIDAVRQRELEQVLLALDAEGIRTLVFKGAALARSHYARPFFRPHLDTDLLLPRHSIAAASRVMESLGYRRTAQVTGALVMHQLDYSKVDRHGVRHIFDLHWKLVNPQALADLLTFEELDAGAAPVAPDSVARAPVPVHALLLACIHRVAHHHGWERLIWHFDVHLLAERLTAAEQACLLELTAQKGIACIALDGLLLARANFDTALPAKLLERLEEQAASEAGSAASEFACRPMSRFDVLVSDLKALGSWRDRARLLREHIFPPASYIMERYSVSNAAILPILYTHRLLSGAWKWLRRTV